MYHYKKGLKKWVGIVNRAHTSKDTRAHTSTSKIPGLLIANKEESKIKKKNLGLLFANEDETKG